ncbi:hypothetical protein NPX13_g1288 [Xylaria arbuscula]|uniref:Uncharacterized protein n=1 Tax=Xylaria arbuscula TaxID=114810 RepID=A0A9W8NMC9_9PEZI|nr:hypothetical protein NPX13_g1288 [Xylaria arbuscula]
MPSWISKLIVAIAATAPSALVFAKPEQIRGVTSPIYHYYLQASPDDATIPVMGPEASSEYFNIIDGAIQSANSSAYLTVGSDSTSYKTLTLSANASTAAPGWALEGDTIITSTTSSWGATTELPRVPGRKRRLLAGLSADG